MIGSGLLVFNDTTRLLTDLNGTMLDVPMQLFRWLPDVYSAYSLTPIINTGCGLNWYFSNTFTFSNVPFMALVGFGTSAVPVSTAAIGTGISGVTFFNTGGYNMSYYFFSGPGSGVFSGLTLGNARFSSGDGTCLRCPQVTPPWTDPANGICDLNSCGNTSSPSCGVAMGGATIDGQFDVFLPTVVLQQDVVLPQLINQNVSIPATANISISSAVMINGNLQLWGVVTLDAGSALTVNGTATVAGTVVLVGSASALAVNNLVVAPGGSLTLLLPATAVRQGSNSFVVVNYTTVSGAFAVNASLVSAPSSSSCLVVSTTQPEYGPTGLVVVVSVTTSSACASGGGLSTGALVGIIVGASVGGVLLALAVVLTIWCQKRSHTKAATRKLVEKELSKSALIVD